MPIRAIEQLSRFLADQLSWRKRELTTLKLVLSKSRQHEQAVFLRAAICLLYAHWEGFIREAATAYISYVATQGLRYRDLAPNFVALGLQSDIKQAGESNSPLLHTVLIVKMTSGQSDNAALSWRDAVDARSNLNSKVLTEILCRVGVDDTAYRSKKSIIDERLIGNRNRVAHGDQYLGIQPDDYAGLHDDIVQLIERFRDDVENAAVTGTYRATPTSE